MLLIDTMYVHDGGGKVLLDYLIGKLEATDRECYYLFDSRTKGNHQAIKSTNQCIYLESSLWNRFQFYKKHTNTFSKIFCFGNLPPNSRMNVEVITYYHSPLYLKSLKEFSYKERFKYRMKRLVLKNFTKNADLWLVQTDFIKEKLSEKFSIDSNKIRLTPFYPPFEASNPGVVREDHSFLFVSNATVHKNHDRLIDAFCSFFDEHKKGTLTLTVSEDYTEVYDRIEKRIAQGYPIINVGFLKRQELKKLYLSTQYLIFPSLAESFGLGLVEAIENGCNVIGADLPYTYAVCEPSMVFNPFEEASIQKAFVDASSKQLPESVSRITNEINTLLTLLE